MLSERSFVQLVEQLFVQMVEQMVAFRPKEMNGVIYEWCTNVI